ncbi:MAG: hypothetical protein H3C62_11895 [Gemmatimonadaceae bacterium]|nr:hypothetical protein [Gemmatimonadaceae bacterium]
MRLLLVLLFLGAVPLAAQAVIDPGMTKAQVVERLGAPAFERAAGEATFLFYRNGCERTCGMNDLVVLERGQVTDAILRSPRRRYSGTSSSPRMIPAAEAAKAKATPAAAPTDAPITIQLKGRKPATGEA